MLTHNFLFCFQAIAILRPDKDSRWRPYFNWLHRLSGMTIYLCSGKNRFDF